MPKWKYTNQQEGPSKKDLFVNLKKNEKTKLKISDWEFLKGHHAGALFKCSVVEQNDVPVDKFWYVWNYELMEELKEKLKGKKITGTLTLTVTRETDEDEVEENFVVKWE